MWYASHASIVFFLISVGCGCDRKPQWWDGTASTRYRRSETRSTFTKATGDSLPHDIIKSTCSFNLMKIFLVKKFECINFNSTRSVLAFK